MVKRARSQTHLGPTLAFTSFLFFSVLLILGDSVFIFLVIIIIPTSKAMQRTESDQCVACSIELASLQTFFNDCPCYC
jgi:hypothetical protein